MSIEFRPLSWALGAEVSGLDLRKPLTPEQVATLRQGWLQHQVLLFRGQDIGPQEHLDLSRHFGPVEPYPLVHYRLPEHPEIFLLTNEPVNGQPSQTRNAGRHWHSDLSFTTRPSTGAILRCVKIPHVGGTTMWANQYLAYETLTPAFRALIDDLHAVHELFSKTRDLHRLDQKQIGDMKRANPPVVQPVVRVHRETGRKALYVSEAVTTRIIGMSQEESDAILEFLFRHQTQVEFTYRHQWLPGDLVMWDNRCTLHQVVADNDHSEWRTMQRSTITGEPCGQLLSELEAQEAALTDAQAGARRMQLA